MKQNILFEDNDILVVYKPAGIATQTARLGQQDMLSELKNYLAGQEAYRGKGEPYLGMIHRLDQPVSGILVFAKTKEAAAKLSAQAADKGKSMQKHYCAVVYGKPEQPEATLTDYLVKNAKTNLSEIASKSNTAAKLARLSYKQVAAGDNYAKLDITLFTGRHHQIRVQLAHAGMPILGDGKYGNEKSGDLSRQLQCRNIALCAYGLEFVHPATGKELSFVIEPKEAIFGIF